MMLYYSDPFSVVVVADGIVDVVVAVVVVVVDNVVYIDVALLLYSSKQDKH